MKFLFSFFLDQNTIEFNKVSDNEREEDYTNIISLRSANEHLKVRQSQIINVFFCDYFQLKFHFFLSFAFEGGFNSSKTKLSISRTF